LAAHNLKLLIEAVKGGDPDLIEDACQNAEASGVSESAVHAARNRIRLIREVSMLETGIHAHLAQDKPAKCEIALACGVDDTVVSLVTDWASQPRESHVFLEAILGDRIVEIERTSIREAAIGAKLFEYTYLAHLEKPFLEVLENARQDICIDRHHWKARILVKDCKSHAILDYSGYIAEEKFPLTVVLKVCNDYLDELKKQVRPMMEKRMLSAAVLGKSTAAVELACREATLVGVFIISVETSQKKARRPKDLLIPELEAELKRDRSAQDHATNKAQTLRKILEFSDEGHKAPKIDKKRFVTPSDAPPSPHAKHLEATMNKLVKSGFDKKVQREYMNCTSHRKGMLRELQDTHKRIDQMGEDVVAWEQVFTSGDLAIEE
jgi:hypothetical protein